MSFLQAIFLGIVQGLTEFLPVSSSGHLVIFQKIFGFLEPPVTFDTLVHFGTLVALVFFFWKDIRSLFTHWALIIKLALGTIPIGIVGFLLKEEVEIIFNSLLLTGISFLITALLLFLTTLIRNASKSIDKISLWDSVIIGLFQALAILPGVSRSGSTISAGIYQGMKREDAFRFSFLLGIIAIFGAVLIQVPEMCHFTDQQIINGLLGFISSAVVGFFALKILKRIVLEGKLYYFGIYCLLLGIICIFLG
ncbi:undecaprenyl-diphosphate phosphatase [bacterium]|nr:undecaprenyl-diphosphate phosphatase [bacterium]